MVWARLVDEDERVTRSQTYGRRLKKEDAGTAICAVVDRNDACWRFRSTSSA